MERPATPGWSTRDLVLLLALLLLGGMVKGVIWQRTAILARDGIGFIEIAQRFDREPWPQVLREAHQHPVYPVHVWLTARAASWIGMPPQSNLDWQQCAHAANVFLGVLVVIPMYVLARPLVGVWGAFAAAFLYQVLPVPAHVTADTLSEGAYLFWAATGLALLTRGLQVWRWYWFILAGLAVGLAYLTRPEGAMITLAGLAVLFWAALRRWQPQPWRRAVLAGLCLGLATAATVTPYWLTIGRLGSKNTFNQMLQAAAPSPAANTTATTLLLATRFQPGVDGFDWDDVTPWFVAAVVVKEIGKGAHYLPAIIALVGLAWFWRRSTKHDDERAAGVLLSALLALNVAVLYWLGYRAHYVSERHTVLITLAACPFVIAGLQQVSAWWARRSPIEPRLATAIMVGVLVATTVMPNLKPRHQQRLVHRDAGFWLASHTGPADHVHDPYGYATFYADRPYVFRRPGIPSKRQFVLMEPGEKDKSRLAVINEVRRKGEAVMAWPSATQPQLVLYQAHFIPPGARAARP